MPSKSKKSVRNPNPSEQQITNNIIHVKIRSIPNKHRGISRKSSKVTVQRLQRNTMVSHQSHVSASNMEGRMDNAVVHPESIIDQARFSSRRTNDTLLSSNGTMKQSETHSPVLSNHNNQQHPCSVNSTSDSHGLITDHHRKKERQKLCSPRIVIIATVTILLIAIIIIATVIPVLLLKSSSKSTPNLVAVLRWNTSGITIAGTSGVSGSSNQSLRTPTDLEVIDYLNVLYVADAGNNRIQKFSLGNLIGSTVAGNANGTGGSSRNEFLEPSGIQVDSSGNLFVSDRYNHRLQLWASSALTGATIAGNDTGTSGNSNTLLREPLGISRDPNNGLIYIADYANHRIMAYTPGSSTMSLVAGGSGTGINRTQIWSPTGIYFDWVSQSMYITSFNGHYILRWVLGSTSWVLAAGYGNGTAGSDADALSSPRHAMIDPMGNMYVVDRGNHRIQFFKAGETVGTTIAGVTGVAGNNATLLNVPRSMRLDSQLNLYVVDASNHRIQKFVRY